MRFRCPHCQMVNDYSEQEVREIYICCKNCRREFRASESSPLTVNIDSKHTGEAFRRLTKMASVQFDKKGRKKPRNSAKLNAEAALYIKQGEYEKAAADLKESLRQNPDQPHVQRLLRKINSQI